MANSYLEIQKVLRGYFDEFNKKYFENELPNVVITVQSKGRKTNTLGWFTVGKIWTDNEDKLHEINISAEFLNRTTEETLTTLMHEMIHLYCAVKGIKDVSRGNTYHNKSFKAEAEKRGLLIEHDKRIGYSLTTASEGLLKFIQASKYYNKFSICRSEIGEAETPKKKKVYYKYTCVVCDGKARTTTPLELKCCEQLMSCEIRGGESDDSESE